MSGGIRFLGELERLELKPGDRFVIHAANPLTREHADRLTQIWRDFVGEAEVDAFPLLILDSGLRLGVIAGAPAVAAPAPLELVCRACGQRTSEGHAFGCPEAGA